MDILYYIGLIIVIGLFFFIDKYTKTQNSMFVIILISFIGFIVVQNTGIEVINYGNYELLENTTATYITESIDVTNSGLGIFTTQAFIILMLWFFMLLASINLLVGKEY
jgi:uncharacterized PurR-regulated membrane protein YhhQ (DUF165 family)